MEVFENINSFIRLQKVTKRKFAENLINLQPRLKSTGETPTEKTVYKYLNGDINIPIELIPYIAEALDITEQELFDTTTKTKLKLYRYLAKGLDAEQINYLNTLNQNSTMIKNIVDETKQSCLGLNFHDNKKISHLIALLEFAPEPLIDKIIVKLEEIKNVALGDFSN